MALALREALENRAPPTLMMQVDKLPAPANISAVCLANHNSSLALLELQFFFLVVGIVRVEVHRFIKKLRDLKGKKLLTVKWHW